MDTVTSRHQAAQGLVEFGLILALVAVVAVAGLLVFGTAVTALITTAHDTIILSMNP